VTPSAALIQVFPAPRLGWAAVSFPAIPEPILVVLLLMEELEHACPRQSLGQRGDLLFRAGLPQSHVGPEGLHRETPSATIEVLECRPSR
jgi:hypothetical protein